MNACDVHPEDAEDHPAGAWRLTARDPEQIAGRRAVIGNAGIGERKLSHSLLRLGAATDSRMRINRV